MAILADGRFRADARSGAHHFRAYAPEKFDYAYDRYTNEARRLYQVLDKRLDGREFVASGAYSIADMAIFPWCRLHRRQGQDLDDFPNVRRWFESMAARPAVAKDMARLEDKADQGVLEMMRVRGSTEPAALGGVLTEGDTFDIDWVVIDEPDPNFSRSAPPINNEAIRHVGLQGIEHNAATFARPEGCWFANGALWFICTRGGSSDAALNERPEDEYGDGRGQVWRYEPARERLTLIFQSTDPAILDMPDSMTISSTGTVLMCEDGKDGNFVRALGPNGTLSDIAQNISKHPDIEFAGICFSPDGRTLFVNLQGIEGTTFAIWRQDNRPLT